MPLYEYRCQACGHQFEKIQRFSDDPIAVCPSCGGGPVDKLLSSPAIQFKGSGWYITDYARKGTPESTSTSSATGEGKPTESSTAGTSSSSTPSSDSSSTSTNKKD